MKRYLAVIVAYGWVTTVAWGQSASMGTPRPAAALGTPTIRAAAARIGASDDVRPIGSHLSQPLDSAEERYNWGLPDRAPARDSGDRKRHKMSEWFGGDSGPEPIRDFEGDRCFEGFVSPFSNPFLSEDPRALTEVRTIYFYQKIPGSQPTLQGGNAGFFGIQARLAITQRWSVVLHELGGVTLKPTDTTPVSGGTGLSEIRIGPKYTFYRDDPSGTVAAAGVIFDIPVGSSSEFQNTGSFGLTPYITAGRRFGKSSYGEFGIINTFGYSFSANNERSQFLYDSIHLDYDVANWQHLYPFVELNWFYYTSNGTNSSLDFEGRDLANVGSAVKGRTMSSLALGARYRFNDHWQAGVGFEFPLFGNKDILDYRIGFDVIWRY